MLQQPEAGPNVDAHHRAKKNLSEQTMVNCLGSHTYLTISRCFFLLLAAENNFRLCAASPKPVGQQDERVKVSTISHK